jgi:hypothetical protein
MIHWKTNEEMGDGFQFDKSEHLEVRYNALTKVETHEKNTMRTKYLVRDWWSKKQLFELRNFINDTLAERGDNHG